jgi:DNA-binding NarL/FixJ family response regulator
MDPMVQLGMTRVLSDRGLEVLSMEGEYRDVVGEVRRLRPDSVIFGMDGETSEELRDEVRAAVPETKVIFWSRDETRMDVFDPGVLAPRRIQIGVPLALLDEVGATGTS